MPRGNAAAMNGHLLEISAKVAQDAHAVLLLDQAGWHIAGDLNVPANIILIPLPPKCPELNPLKTAGSSCGRIGLRTESPNPTTHPRSLRRCLEETRRAAVEGHVH